MKPVSPEDEVGMLTTPLRCLVIRINVFGNTLIKYLIQPILFV